MIERLAAQDAGQKQRFSPAWISLDCGRGFSQHAHALILTMDPRGMLWSLLAGTVLLNACARFQPAPLSATQTAAALESRSLTNSDLRAFLEHNLGRPFGSWPPTQWEFGNLTLVAFYYHPSLEVARAAWRVAKAGEVTAGARPNPVLSVTPAFAANAESGVSPWLTTVDLEVPIETAGKRGHRIAQATNLSAAARWNIAAAAWKVRSGLRSSLVDWNAASRREQLLARAQQLQDDLLKRQEARLAAGAIAATDLLSLRVLRSKTVLDLGDARQRAAEARARVAQALGVPLAALADVDLALDLPARIEFDPAQFRRQALLARSDIRAALAEYAAAQAALQLQISKQYPDVRLGPGYEYDQGENKWALGVSVELPVFHHNQGPVAEATARRAEKAARCTALQASVIGELDRALAGYQAAQEQLGRSETLLQTVQAQQQAVERQVKAGAADQVDLLNASWEVANTALTRWDACVRAQQAVGALEDAVQQPFPSGVDFEREPTGRERGEAQ